MDKKSEQEILTALVQGDHKAFDEIFITFFGKVRFFIFGIIKSDAESEELTQAIFVKLWISRTLIDPSKPFSPYLFTMARNAVYNHIKHKRVRSNFALHHAQQEEQTVCTEESIYAKDMSNKVNKMVDKMPEQRRRIFRMSKYIGLSNGEIAAQLSIAKKTVENQLSLAVHELRKKFNHFYS